MTDIQQNFNEDGLDILVDENCQIENLKEIKKKSGDENGDKK